MSGSEPIRGRVEAHLQRILAGKEMTQRIRPMRLQNNGMALQTLIFLPGKSRFPRNSSHHSFISRLSSHVEVEATVAVLQARKAANPATAVPTLTQFSPVIVATKNWHFWLEVGAHRQRMCFRWPGYFKPKHDLSRRKKQSWTERNVKN